MRVMHVRRPHALAAALRLPRRTLRAQLAVLYAALFGLAVAVVTALGVIFQPDFLVRTGCTADSDTASLLVKFALSKGQQFQLPLWARPPDGLEQIQ